MRAQSRLKYLGEDEQILKPKWDRKHKVAKPRSRMVKFYTHENKGKNYLGEKEK